MNLDKIRNFCNSLPQVTESFPFDEEVLVWKVAGKIFCLGNIHAFDSINLKCDPERAVALREEYPQIVPGWHMNKTMWNTVYLDGLQEKFIESLILHSYREVVRKLPKKIQSTIKL
ncbi:MAG: MmcQ/YjbR family DNA-binding protein [Sphingomonadales bacterium]